MRQLLRELLRRGMEISRWKNDQELGGGVQSKPGIGR
jgi:hypothetical protein